MIRQYLKKSILELEELSKKHKNNSITIKKIEFELGNRKTKRAKSLLAEIQEIKKEV